LDHHGRHRDWRSRGQSQFDGVVPWIARHSSESMLIGVGHTSIADAAWGHRKAGVLALQLGLEAR
jgi:hypothetical protein